MANNFLDINSTANSLLNRNSRYVSGGTSELHNNRIEWWDRNTYEVSADDQFVTVTRNTENRLDLIANLYLGTSQLWWLIAQYNRILDPSQEVVDGAILRIPSKQRVQSMITGKIGGVKSTRQNITENYDN